MRAAVGRDTWPREERRCALALLTSWEGDSTVLTPADLRENARLLRGATGKETSSHLKTRLASYALALAQLAEKVEREETAQKDEGEGATGLLMLTQVDRVA